MSRGRISPAYRGVPTVTQLTNDDKSSEIVLQTSKSLQKYKQTNKLPIDRTLILYTNLQAHS